MFFPFSFILGNLEDGDVHDWDSKKVSFPYSFDSLRQRYKYNMDPSVFAVV